MIRKTYDRNAVKKTTATKWLESIFTKSSSAKTETIFRKNEKAR
jgi:hypothetical protein